MGKGRTESPQCLATLRFSNKRRGVQKVGVLVSTVFTADIRGLKVSKEAGNTPHTHSSVYVKMSDTEPTKRTNGQNWN